MSEKHKSILKKMIEKKGFENTLELLGIGATELAVKSGIEINKKVAYLILVELLIKNKIPKEYKGFGIYLSIEDESTIRWSKSIITDYYGVELEEEIQAIATPFYSGDWEGLPVDVDFYELVKPGTNEEVYYTDLWAEYATEMKSKSSFENLEELLEWYRDFYLPMTYEYIINYCLPHIRKRVYDKVIKNIR